MNELELKNQIKSLEREYLDLRNAMSSLTGNLNNSAILRGTLSGAGASAESILKCIIRIEKINIKSKDPNIPAERADELRKTEVQGLMLDEMIKLVEPKIPLRILTHLRTIQAWRNIGSHDKGEQTINETVNSSTLQVVSLALSELVNWFVGDYLSHDTSGFIFRELAQNNIKTVAPIDLWKEEFWYAMKKGSLKALDEAKLNKIQSQHNISPADIQNLKSNFLRKDEYFNQILEEAFEDELIEIDELEAIEHSRSECCISSREAREMLEKFNWKSKYKDDPEKLQVDWMREELVSHKPIVYEAAEILTTASVQNNENNTKSVSNENIVKTSSQSGTISLKIDFNWSAIQFRTLFSSYFNFIYFRIENNAVPNKTKLSELITDKTVKSFEISEAMTLRDFEAEISKLLNKRIDVFYEKTEPGKKNKKYVQFPENQKDLTVVKSNEYAMSDGADHLDYWYKPYHK